MYSYRYANRRRRVQPAVDSGKPSSVSDANSDGTKALINVHASTDRQTDRQTDGGFTMQLVQERINPVRCRLPDVFTP